MDLKKIHYFSGLTLTVFVGLHLLNHSFSIGGADKHIDIMTTLRYSYRNPVVETVLLLAVATQIFSGLRLFGGKRKTAETFFEKLQIWTGLYLALFFVIHLGAVFAGRFILHLDTNFYFGVAGLNSFPFHLFFIPYYSLAVISFFGHVSSIHNHRMKKAIFGISPRTQSICILAIGICFTIFLIYGLTNRFQGFEIPESYKIVIGK